jgi:hypothetical protein
MNSSGHFLYEILDSFCNGHYFLLLWHSAFEFSHSTTVTILNNFSTGKLFAFGAPDNWSVACSLYWCKGTGSLGSTVAGTAPAIWCVRSRCCSFVYLLVEVEVTLRLTASQSVSLGVEPPSAAHDQIIFFCLTFTVGCCGAPSLTRGRVWLVGMVLALPSAVFLGSESLGTRDHILLSQTRDFPFRRLLRLGTDPIETPFILVAYCFSRVFTIPLPSTGCPLLLSHAWAGSRLLSRCLAVGIHVTIF